MFRDSVKTILISLLVFATLASGFSQTQERKLVDRVMKPDMQMGNPLQNKAFSSSSSLAIKSSAAGSKEFYDIKAATTKDFAFTRSFLGIKNPWFGGKVFATKSDSSISKYDVRQAERAFSEKKADATGYYDATKEANFGSPVVPTRAFVPQPAAQGSVSRISDKINEKMTIDEVRELLNKPR